ncbi:MAG: hypothetical protein ACOC85_01655 [Thermoplasmatota archaeon]
MDMIKYLIFSLGFIITHTFIYIIAGIVTYPLVHKGHPIYDYYLRKEEEEKGWSKAMRLLLPAQLLRGFLFSLVLYPIMGYMNEFSLLMSFLFLFGLLYVFSGFASHIPFPGNIEGSVYVREKFQKSWWKFHIEDLIYCPIVAFVVAWFLV